MNIKHILDVAPPTPACYASRTAWSEYLHTAQRTSSKPFVRGVYRPAFNFCSECTRDFKEGMAAVGKCNPDKFRALVLVKVAA